MSLRLLVFAALRVYAICLMVQTLALIPLYIQVIGHDTTGTRGVWILLEPFGAVFASLILWIFAERLAALVVRSSEPAIDKFALTLEAAYTFGFFLLGLYFVLSTIGSTLQQLYYVVAVVAQLPESDPQRSLALFQLYQPGITVIAGFTSLLGASFWARKLVALGERIRS